MTIAHRIAPCLWFDDQAEEAVRFYSGIFGNARTVAISLQVNCETQEEVDHYWTKLSAGGDPNAQQCGWLKDRYGVSWQVVPTIVPQLMSDPDAARAGKAMQALFGMKKIDIAELRRAYSG